METNFLYAGNTSCIRHIYYFEIDELFYNADYTLLTLAQLVIKSILQ